VIDVEAVKAALRTTAILDAFGVRYRDAPTIRLTVQRTLHAAAASSSSSPHSRASIRSKTSCVSSRSLRRSQAFIERTSSSEQDEIRVRAARGQAKYERELAERRAGATAGVPGRWAALARRSAEGERYLAGRGLDPLELVARDAVRFDRDDPAVALHAYDGAIVNIARQRRDPAASIKAPVLASCTTDGILVGRVDEIDCSGGGPDVAVLEGITDTLAGVLAFPGCVVAGAHCADRLPHVAAAIAPRLVAARGWLLIVPHVDGGKGEECAADAVRVASRAGLRLDESIHLVDVRPSKDLADAWRTVI
jgi:hypothetical protein